MRKLLAFGLMVCLAAGALLQAAQAADAGPIVFAQATEAPAPEVTPEPEASAAFEEIIPVAEETAGAVTETPAPEAWAEPTPTQALPEEEAVVWDPPAEPSYAIVVTEKGTLNMRRSPNGDSKILARLPRDTIIEVLADGGEWTQVRHDGLDGYVMSSYIQPYDAQALYSALSSGDEGELVLEIKRELYRLDYIKKEDINKRFDAAMEAALTKVQLMNDVPLDPKHVTPELQAMFERGEIRRGKLGSGDTETDAESGLTLSIFCWDTGGTLFEEDNSVRVTMYVGAQASGGVGPYDITIKRSLGREAIGEVVENTFTTIWPVDRECLYVYVTAVDAQGNRVTACVPYRYTMPQRYNEG